MRDQAISLPATHLSYAQILPRIIKIAVEVSGLPETKIRPESRLVQDLRCDSIDFLDFLFRIEKAFSIPVPYGKDDPLSKMLFTRPEFRISDFAEFVYLSQGRFDGVVVPRRRFRKPRPVRSIAPFTQLDGAAPKLARRSVLELLEQNEHGLGLYHRQLDGMVCVQIPAVDAATIGTDSDEFPHDERPQHSTRLSGYLIDRETVSTSAYSRFLNSIGKVDEKILCDWFHLDDQDHRHHHAQLRRDNHGWEPIAGCERKPMMLVSWYGANAYALWVNGRDWRNYDANNPRDSSFLPSEAQWEHAARGGEASLESAPTEVHSDLHEPGESHTLEDMPLLDVNIETGTSPFGVRQMAGNVWQWCRDWYAPDFYARINARADNAVNHEPTGIRSERGGSWVGPAFLCHLSYRRGREPIARGRCLGFRCISDPADVDHSNR